MQNTVKTDQSVVNEVERTKFKRALATIAKDWRLYVLLIPMLAFLICFKYLPIRGILEGFKWGSYSQSSEYLSQWCGSYWLEYIFVGPGRLEFWRAFRNTFVNSMYGLILGFPIPIFLALLFSEVKVLGYRSILQVCSYLPHFVSMVVVTTIITLWCTGDKSANTAPGIIYKALKAMHVLKDDIGILAHPRYFRPIYQISGIWEGAGYGSIVYFAAILAISPTSYEAARIDGATKMQQIRFVTIPGMAPTLTIMLIMRIGHILNIGYEKIILLIGNTQSAWETGDVVSTLVYRMTGRGGALENVQIITQLGVVADLFNSLIAMVLVLGANAISRRVSSTSLF